MTDGEAEQRYEVAVEAFDHISVEAKSADEAREKARKRATRQLGTRWQISDIRPTELGGGSA